MHTYFIASSCFVKIGKTRDPAKRLKQIQAHSPVRLSIVLLIEGDSEKYLHERFDLYRRDGSEWFHFSPEIQAFIKNGDDWPCYQEDDDWPCYQEDDDTLVIEAE